MVRTLFARPLRLTLPFVWLVIFGACANAASIGASTGASTAIKPPCATRATASAFAYSTGSNLAGNIPQPPGAPLPAASTLSAFIYPLGIPHEASPTVTFSAFAPDAAHLAAAVQQVRTLSSGSFAEYSPYIVDTATQAVTKVPLAQPIVAHQGGNWAAPPPRRLFAWADTHTLIIFANADLNAPLGPSYSYDITSNTLTPLPGVTGALEGVVRCSVLFYLTAGAPTYLDGNLSRAPVLIHRYDLSSHTAIGVPVFIGDAAIFEFPAQDNQPDYPGWDASPDGSHLAYQQMTGAKGPSFSSIWLATKADGTGPVPILPSVSSDGGVRMAISPDGTLVAVTQAHPAPSVFVGPLSGGAVTKFISPIGLGQPAWLANSGGFFASSTSDAIPASVLLFSLRCRGACVGAPVVANASNPATLP
jgi:hypothetical protein